MKISPSLFSSRPRRRQTVVVSAILGAAIIAVVVLVVGSGHGARLSSAQVAVVATQAGKSSAEVRVDKTPQPVVIVNQGGIGVTGLIPTATLVTGGATASGTSVPMRVVSDPLHGVAAIAVAGSSNVASLPRGSTANLHVGDELVLSIGANTALMTVTYEGKVTVPLGTSGFRQQVLDLKMPSTNRPSVAAILDGSGRLVGIVTSDRQTGAPPDHVYAIPIEQAADAINRLSATATPTL